VKNSMRAVMKFLGPHPYNPPLMFLFFWAFYFSRYVPLGLAEPPGAGRLRAFVTIVLIAAVPASAFSGVAILWNRFRPWPENKFRYYALEVAISFMFLNLTFTYTTQNPYFDSVGGLRATSASLTPIFLVVTYIFTLLLLAGLHQTESRIRNRLDNADTLVARLERESRVLVLSEVELKDQVSRFLHDRVQSNLMVLSLRLRELTDLSNEDERTEINRIIDDLENLRMQDLRLAIASLSPNLETTDLRSAIKSLLGPSRSGVNVTVVMPPRVDDFANELKMAIYKISEQAILNSRMHGKATHILVEVSESGKDTWNLCVADDGLGKKAELGEPGLGTAIIESWARLIGGNKRITSTEYGYTLAITFGSK